MTRDLTDREVAATIAALVHFRNARGRGEDPRYEIASKGGTILPLSAVEIGDLIDTVRWGRVTVEV